MQLIVEFMPIHRERVRSAERNSYCCSATVAVTYGARTHASPDRGRKIRMSVSSAIWCGIGSPRGASTARVFPSHHNPKTTMSWRAPPTRIDRLMPSRVWWRVVRIALEVRREVVTGFGIAERWERVTGAAVVEWATVT
jgi:hypothetical protein